MDKLKELIEETRTTEFPDFNSGDRIKVHVRVIEGKQGKNSAVRRRRN